MKEISQNFRKKVIWFSFWACMFIGALLVLSQIGYSDGDDAYFYEFTHSMGFVPYLKWRYEQWVGRMAGEALVYFAFHMGLPFWRIVNALMLTLLPIGVLRLSVIAARVPEGNFGTWNQKASACADLRVTECNLLTCLTVVSGYLLMSAMTLGYAAVWVNGSIFYTWTFTCGIWALVPVAELVFTGHTDWKNFIYGIPCAVIASMSIEQMAAVLLVFEVLAVLYIFGWKREKKWLMLIQAVVTLIAFVIMFTAPGNDVRIAVEVNTWMPEYETMTIGQHLFITVQWLLSSFANENKMFLIAIWIAGIFLLLEREKRTAGTWVLVGSAGVFSLAAILPYFGITLFSDMGMNIGNIEQCITRVPQLADLTGGNIAAMLWWLAVLIFTFVFLWKVSGFQITLLLAYLAGIASEAIMFFSPTMYASGARVYYLTDLLYLFIALALSHGIQKNAKRNLYNCLFVGAGVWNFLYQIPVFLGRL